MDKVIGVAELRKSMASVIKEVHEKGSHYVIIQRSKAKAVLLSPEEVETLEVMADKELLEDIKQAKEDFLNSRFSTYEDFFDERLPEKPAQREKSKKPSSK